MSYPRHPWAIPFPNSSALPALNSYLKGIPLLQLCKLVGLRLASSPSAWDCFFQVEFIDSTIELPHVTFLFCTLDVSTLVFLPDYIATVQTLFGCCRYTLAIENGLFLSKGNTKCRFQRG